MGNSRGNKYSRNHKNLDPAEEDFWDFSFHEMGIYDTPASLNYILNINKSSKKIIYFGHSQGGASLLAGMCEKYNFYKEKLLVAILLAPASRVDNINSSLLQFFTSIDIDDRMKKFNINEVFPFDPDMIDFNIKISRFYPTMSYAMLEMTSDEVSWVNCPDRIKVFFSHYPSGTSRKSLTHFKQLILSQKFQKFDYGEKLNQELYRSEKPPEYDLSSLKDIPLIICGGLNDKLTHINDIRWLRDQLKNINNKFFSYYEFEHMGHASFLLNSDMTWFNFVLHDLYKVIKFENSNWCCNNGLEIDNNCNNKDNSNNLNLIKEDASEPA